MTREIKFRVWEKRSLIMRAWDYLRGIDYKHQFALFYDPDFVFMQFTGLLDKNGVEIYEGDILEFSDKWEWYRGDYGIKMAFADEEKRKELKAKYDAEPMYRRVVEFDPFEGYQFSKSDLKNYFVVVGNIYENPELLNEKEK